MGVREDIGGSSDLCAVESRVYEVNARPSIKAAGSMSSAIERVLRINRFRWLGSSANIHGPRTLEESAPRKCSSLSAIVGLRTEEQFHHRFAVKRTIR